MDKLMCPRRAGLSPGHDEWETTRWDLEAQWPPAGITLGD